MTAFLAGPANANWLLGLFVLATTGIVPAYELAPLPKLIAVSLPMLVGGPTLLPPLASAMLPSPNG